MAEDYTFPFPYQYPSSLKAQQNNNPGVEAPGEHVMMFLLAYSAALFTKVCSQGIVVKFMMN